MSTPSQPQDPYQPSEGSTGDSGTPQYGQTPSYGQPPAYGQTPQYGAPQDPAGGYPSYPSAQPYAQTPMYGYPKNTLGVWSLVLGIVGLVLCGFVTGTPAVILGNNAKKAVARGEANNGGMATAGQVLGWISIAWGVIGIIVLATGNYSWSIN
ncbi:DUF4190 domain-containing protein [Cellulomonas sp. NPDC089187]|uniref:DUF4190 domain-containing protein n=1 Tax=Cellulomonas sp. NPDC089187 TaxID=3154970 RepID=UPI0034257E1A